ncbi:MAG: SusD/RagB family nutrient-binding outer membrane lipoprotein [Bacteroidota bacterium]|nr:SusD/RagB family nutrient-binding outer membrane lipoprotein [Bacteroidota bacterium]
MDANIDPTVAYTINPENQFVNGSRDIFGNDFEAYYETYRDIMPWVQLTTPTSGNLKNFTASANPFGRYDNLYGRGGGSELHDVNVLISKLQSPKKESYQQLGAIARILLDYEAFYVSDIYGSIAYSQAFMGRTTGVFTVPFDKQQDVFNAIDADLKSAIQDIKSAPSGQFAIGTYDQFYFGDVTKWVKAANALRLRMAMRIMKVDNAKAGSIMQEVFASQASDLMSDNTDSWTFYAPATFTSGGNWNPDGLRAPRALTTFMVNNTDPRTRDFFTKNSYSQENFDLAKAQGVLSTDAVFVDQRYVGSFASPDSSASLINKAKYYTTRQITKGGGKLNLDTLSNINPRIFQVAFSGGSGNNGTGVQYIPLITYADYCFMLAELSYSGIKSDDPATWYNKGITASIQYYGKMAQDGMFLDYYLENGLGMQVPPPSQAEIDNYLAMPAVKYNPAKGLDMIASQSFINFFKEPNEAWALIKRTGMPNNTTTLMLERLLYNGTDLAIPRRAPRNLPPTTDINYANISAAFTDMQSNPGYGSGPADISGRVWWDVP